MASAEGWAVDTSVAIAALDAGHAAHSASLAAVRRYRPALAGHTAYEVYAVLTRLPGQLAVDPTDAAALIDRVFPDVVWLGPGVAGWLPRGSSVALSTTLSSGKPLASVADGC